jgi:hypothetical protein
MLCERTEVKPNDTWHRRRSTSSLDLTCNHMRVDLNDWKNGWNGVEIALDVREIDLLIERLTMLKNDPDQHFHISSDYKAPGVIGDIEIYVRQPDQVGNMWIGGKALLPGDEI